MVNRGISIICIVYLLSCSENNKQFSSTEIYTPSAPEEIPLVDPATNFPIMAKYDCKSCHKTAEKFQGPSYNEISDKYAGQSTAVKYLSKKLIEGGVGVWGTIPMNPHPNMSQSDADEISKFILSINK